MESLKNNHSRQGEGGGSSEAERHCAYCNRPIRHGQTYYYCRLCGRGPLCNNHFYGDDGCAFCKHKKFPKWGIALIVIAVLAIGVGLICVVPLKTVSYTVNVPYQGIETYYEKEPYQVEEPYTYTREESQTLWSGEFLGSAGTYRGLARYIDVTNKSQNVVRGTVRANTDGDFLFYVLDRENFDAYRATGSWQAYVSSGRVTSYSFSFVPDHSDYYYLVVSKISSWYEPVDMSVAWSWTESKEGCRTVTKYRDMEKQRTVTKYRQETRYKDVTILEYLTSY